jgi:hypothetical protein
VDLAVVHYKEHGTAGVGDQRLGKCDEVVPFDPFLLDVEMQFPARAHG